ncbi:hypothetical protein ABK040_013714 [Willaertia magna]
MPASPVFSWDDNNDMEEDVKEEEIKLTFEEEEQKQVATKSFLDDEEEEETVAIRTVSSPVFDEEEEVLENNNTNNNNEMIEEEYEEEPEVSAKEAQKEEEEETNFQFSASFTEETETEPKKISSSFQFSFNDEENKENQESEKPFKFSSTPSSPSSQIGLSQYQKQQQNIYQVDDIEFTPPSSSSTVVINKSPSRNLDKKLKLSPVRNNDKIIDSIIVNNNNNSMMELEEEDEQVKAFHEDFNTKKKEEKIVTSPIISSTFTPSSPVLGASSNNTPQQLDNNNESINNEVSKNEEKEEKPKTPVIEVRDRNTQTDDDVLDDLKELEELEDELLETEEEEQQIREKIKALAMQSPQKELQHSLIPTQLQTPSKTFSLRRQITTNSSITPNKKPLSFLSHKKVEKDDIQFTPEFPILPKPSILDEIENVENTEEPKLVKEKPTSPKHNWKDNLKKSPVKEYKPDREIVVMGDYFGLQTFQRGNKYYFEDKVFDINVETLPVDDDTNLICLNSKCWGSNLNYYEQKIIFDERTIIFKKCTCTCPVETKCKHSCASILTWFNCKKDNTPLPKLDSLGSKLEKVISELNHYKQQCEILQKENEELKDRLSIMSDDNSDTDIHLKEMLNTSINSNNTVTTTPALTPPKGGFFSSNNFEKTPHRDTLPFNTPESSPLKRKRQQQQDSNNLLNNHEQQHHTDGGIVSVQKKLHFI